MHSDEGVEEPRQVDEAQVDFICVLAQSEAVAVVGVVAEEAVAEEQEGEEEEGAEKEAESTVMVLLQ